MANDLRANLNDEAELIAELGAILVDLNRIELSRDGNTFTLSTTRDGETKTLTWHDGRDGSDAEVTEANINAALGTDIKADLQQLKRQNSELIECILEMSQIIYA